MTEAARDLTANDFQITIRPAGAANDDWSAFPESSAKSTDSWDAFPEVGAVTASGLAKASGTGVAKGVLSMLGAPGDLREAASKGVDYLANKAGVDPSTVQNVKDTASTVASMSPFTTVFANGPTTQDLQTGVEGATGVKFHEPQNMPERFMETGGEFLPAAVAGPGGFLRKAAQVIVPAVASQVAGEATAGTAYEPYAKAGAAILAGGGTAALTRPGGAGAILRNQWPKGITSADVQQAHGLIQDAGQRGISLTWPEALSQVTGKPVLADTQRLLESSARTRPHMQEFFGNRPKQFDQAALNEFQNIAPGTRHPSMIGPEASRTAGEAINDVRKTVNKASEPYYQAAEGVTLTPAEMSHVKAIPNWTEARDAVRNGPNAWRVEHLPDNSVGFLNAVKKHFDTAGKNAASKFNAQRSHETQGTYEAAASALKQIGVAKSVDYDLALQIQQRARAAYLEPLLKGPLGRIADQPDTKKAINALFPSNPLPNSHNEIATAVGALAKRNPWAAQQLVRAHIESVFNEATQSLQGGPSQWGAAKFAAVLTGNAQQRANLQAAVEALPNGQKIWDGFDRFLQAAEATGQRQAIGSKTAFNAEELKGLSNSNFVGEAVKIGASPGKWWTAVKDKWDHWSQGRNLDQLAKIITDPRSGKLLTRISQLPSGSREAQYVASRLILQSDVSTQPQPRR